MNVLATAAERIIDSFAALTWADAAPIGSLVLLEGILSVDNAVVLTVLVKDLADPVQQRRALRVGILFAYLVRFVTVFFASYLLGVGWITYAAALYLIHVGWAGMRAKKEAQDSLDEGGFAARWAGRLGFSPFWRVVAAVELADVAFSVDSITAALAFSPKLAVVFIGGCLGILAMRFAAQVFLGLIERYPVLEKAAFLLVFLIGAKLLAHAGAFPDAFGVTWFTLDYHVPEALGMSMTFVIFFGALALARLFPDSWVGRLGRPEVGELHEEIGAYRP